MLAWIGIALLSVSWLPGLGYYHPVDWPAWIVLVVAGTALLTTTAGRHQGPRESGLAALLSLPALGIARWPYQAAFWGIVVGGAIQAWPLAVTGIRVIAAWFRGQRPEGSLHPAEDSLPGWLAGILGRVSRAGVIGGCVLAAQALAIQSYEVWTSRSHELPSLLAKLIGAVAGALGMEVGVHGSDVALFSYFHRPSLLGATWELLLDPATWCFLVGGVVLVVWRLWPERPETPSQGPSSPQGWRIARALLWFLLPVLLWLPVRTGVLLSLYLHDVVRMDLGQDLAEAPMLPMRLFWSTPLHLLLLAGPVLLAWRLVPRPGAAETAPTGQPSPTDRTRRARARAQGRPLKYLTAGLLAALGVGCFSAGVFWDPVGQAKGGRILIEDNRWTGDSIWDRTRNDARWHRTRTNKRYDKTWYGELSGYNYYCITEYARHFFPEVTPLAEPTKMVALPQTDEGNAPAGGARTEPPQEIEVPTEPPRRITDTLLKDYDVLVLKVPGRPFADDEIDAIEEFVRGGGGLLFIGDHTNVYGHATYLNRVAERFGFRFRYDCLLGIDKPWEDHYAPPLVPHPIVQHLREMDFATSCSIAPGASHGRAPMRAAGFKNLPPDYFAPNLQPAPDDRPQMRYGAFVQVWSMRCGRGRVAAFTDSTSFSNFCVFEPGKKEIWMGLVDWLNHRSPWLDPFYPLVIAGLLLGCGSLWFARTWNGGWLALVGCGVLGWALAVVGVRAAQQSAMPLPKPLPDRPLVEVVMDQTVCSARLPKSGTVSAKDDSFGIFERWILRLGYFTARLDDPDEFRANALVFLHPDLPVGDRFRQRVRDYVEQGGKVLVVESPAEKQPEDQSDRRSHRPTWTPCEIARKDLAAKTKPQANRLLEPFRELSVDDKMQLDGQLQSSKGWPAVPVANAFAVRGGKPFAWVNGKPVGTTMSWGSNGGSVTLIGFGSRFKDAQMGGTDFVELDKLDPEQAQTLKNVYQWHFGLFPALIEGTLAEASAAPN